MCGACTGCARGVHRVCTGFTRGAYGVCAGYAAALPPLCRCPTTLASAVRGPACGGGTAGDGWWIVDGCVPPHRGALRKTVVRRARAALKTRPPGGLVSGHDPQTREVWFRFLKSYKKKHATTSYDTTCAVASAACPAAGTAMKRTNRRNKVGTAPPNCRATIHHNDACSLRRCRSCCWL